MTGAQNAPERADLAPGVVNRIAPGLRHVLAPNPSAMTGPGTNTYLLGDTALAVIDPGPDDADHLAAILQAVGPGQHISHILVTHAHLDHSALAPRLAAATGAPVCGFGPAHAGRSATMQRLAAGGLSDGGEGIDSGFAPDLILQDGTVLSAPGWALEAIHSPGHMGNHLSFALGEVLFTGDAVMGWSTSLVSPPDGDMGAYMATLARLARRSWQQFLPGHGPAVTAPAARLQELTTHRQQREAAILAALASGPATAAMLARKVYTTTPAALMGAASRNTLAHLIDLQEKRRVTSAGDLDADTIFAVS